MSNKLQIETKVRRLIHYIEDIEKGLIQIPAFQRDFIWEKKDKLDLFDSLKRGYPIGSILFWKPYSKDFGESEKIGPYYVPDKKEDYFYILDGFQRLSTLFGCLTNPKNTELVIDKEEWKKEYLMCYDLKDEEFFFPRSSNLENYQIPIYKLIDTFEFISFSQEIIEQTPDAEISSKYVNRGKALASRFVDFSLPSVDIKGGEIEEAIEIFSRVNSKGSKISTDWMVSALSYNKDRDFRLGTIIDDLINELSVYNYDKIKRELIFQCITNSFGKAFFDQSGKIEELAVRNDFISVTKKTVESIKKSVEFLFQELAVVDIKLLPYKNQLIFFTDFFNMIPNPTTNQLEVLKKWFWITTYSNYFTIYSLSKQREAYNLFQQFLRGEVDDPIYNDNPKIPFSVLEFPNKIFFGSVRAKALVLFMLNFSNDFKKLDIENIEGFGLNYLFKHFKDEKGNNYPESSIPYLMAGNNKFRRTNNMSSLLVSYEKKFEKYFITIEMAQLFKRDDKIAILEKRKQLIIHHESHFVEKLGLSYSPRDVEFSF